MGVPTHWGVTGNGGDGGDQGIYRLPPEHGRAINCDPYYHGILSRRWLEQPALDILGSREGHAATEGGEETGAEVSEAEGE